MQGFSIAVLMSLSLLTLPCWSNPRGAAHVEFLFREADANGDGVITVAESHAAAAREFRRHDLDGDGVWSIAEVRKQQLDAGASQLPPDIQAKVISGALALYDVDGDGRITLENFQQAQLRLLMQADFDRDGQVTLQEARQLFGVAAP